MGVPGLWDVLRPAGTIRSLTHLSVVDGFEVNANGHRGFRVGIDASIWFFHAAYGKEGENPELRTLFFRCSRLMNMPFLPLFVFDGPKRPSIKRGKHNSGNSHWLTTGMKNIIEAFGFEWRTAPGEAEAELAYLNRIGLIDGIISDDVDNFLFGAIMVIRNPSNTLSGNKSHPIKNSAGRDDGNHAVVYLAKDLSVHPDIMLTQGGLILIGLLSGGDYHPAGLVRCGPGIAHGLAKCGFGDSLLQAVFTLSEDKLAIFLKTWRQQIREELRTNSQGHLGRKNPSLAKSVPEDFPDIDVLLSYAKPVTSESEGKVIKVDWNKEPDLGKIASLCELYFEWGVKEIIIKRFRTVLWPSAVLRILRRAVMDIDERALARITPSTPKRNGRPGVSPIGTPSSMIAKRFSSLKINSPTSVETLDDDDERLIVKIHSTRRHVSSDGILEYRLEIDPSQLIRLTEAGVRGIRPPIMPASGSDQEYEAEEEEGQGRLKGTKKALPDPRSHLRMWMPASMVRLAEPSLVDDYENAQRKKHEKKTKDHKAVPNLIAQKGPAAIQAEANGKSPSRRKPPSRKKDHATEQNSTRIAAKPEKLTLSMRCPINDDRPYRLETSKHSNLKTARAQTQKKTLTTFSEDIIELSDTDEEDMRVAPVRAVWKASSAAGASQTLSSRGSTLLIRASASNSEVSPEVSRPVSRVRQIQPFPLWEEEESVERPVALFTNKASYSSSSRAKQHRQRGSVPSDSDSERRGLQKSPRKSVKHSSPRSMHGEPQLSDGGPENKMRQRPVSPSPRGQARTPSNRPVRLTKPNVDLIELSSDSSDTGRLPLAPLLLARAKDKRYARHKNINNGPGVGHTSHKLLSEASTTDSGAHFIDLT